MHKNSQQGYKKGIFQSVILSGLHMCKHTYVLVDSKFLNDSYSYCSQEQGPSMDGSLNPEPFTVKYCTAGQFVNWLLCLIKLVVCSGGYKATILRD